MAQAIDRLFATPTMSACFPERSGKLARSLFGAVMLAGGPAGTARISRIALVRFRESRRAGILEPALPIRLANGELRNRPRRRLRFNARQTRADQRPVQ